MSEGSQDISKGQEFWIWISFAIMVFAGTVTFCSMAVIMVMIAVAWMILFWIAKVPQTIFLFAQRRLVGQKT